MLDVLQGKRSTERYNFHFRLVKRDICLIGLNALDVHQPSPTSVGVDGHTETEPTPIQIDGPTESGEHGSEFVSCVEGDAAEYDCGPYLDVEPIPFGEEHDVRVETHIPQATAVLPPTALAHFRHVINQLI